MNLPRYKIFIGLTVFPLFLVLLGLLYTKVVDRKISDGGIYVIAKGLSWEPSEDMNGLLNLEIIYKGKKYSESAGGCREGVSKYFIVLFNKDRILKTVLFNCSDSIRSGFIESNSELIGKSWEQKPDTFTLK